MIINTKKILIIIPARGGSKGIPDKNIYVVNGKPLIEYTINYAKSLNFDKDILVSTDSPDIARVATSLGLDIPFLRPPELSTDFIGDMPVIKHGLIEFQKLTLSEYEMIIMLQPTSPIRTNKQVTQALKLMRKSDYDSVISVSKVDKKYSPLKQFLIESQRLVPFSSESKNIFNRQQLSDSYIRNGVIYIFKPEFVLNSESVFSDNSGFVLIDEPCINIDSPEDILTFEEFLKSNLLDFE